MIGRRSVLRLLGVGAVAGRAAAEATARDLSGLRIGGLGGPNAPPGVSALGQAIENGPGQGPANYPREVGNLSRTAARGLLKTVLANPADRDELMGLLNQVHRSIYRIDPDIGGRRSWSLAAKIAYQRERNVERDIEESFRDQSPWAEVRSWWRDKVLRVFGLNV